MHPAVEHLRQYKPFGKVYPNDPALVREVMARYPEMIQEPVFCTDSIVCEYAHLDFVKSFGARLIEMETSSFYLMADLLEKPAIALLAVSDNSATGDPLVGRTEEQKRLYDITRKQVIPRILMEIAGM